jgi:hypothetical protein
MSITSAYGEARGGYDQFLTIASSVNAVYTTYESDQPPDGCGCLGRARFLFNDRGEAQMEPGDLPLSITQMPNGWLKTMLEINYYKPRDQFTDEAGGFKLTGAGKDLVLSMIASAQTFGDLAKMAGEVPRGTLVTTP